MNIDFEKDNYRFNARASAIIFNETKTKSFINGEIKEKEYIDEQKEISKYTVKKTLEYKKYLLDDIKNDKLSIQEKLSNILNNEIIVDDKKVSIDEYLMANIEPEITKKVDELVDLLVQSKYSSITFYYENIINDIVNQYKENKVIDKEEINICTQIMNTYYYGVNAIDNIFNVI